MNYPIVSRHVSLLLSIFSLSIAGAIPFAVWYLEWGELLWLLISMLIGLGVSGLIGLHGRSAKGELLRHETIAVVGLTWVLAPAIGAVPMLPMTEWSFTDAYFESISGLTTTGSTILAVIEGKSRSLLFWRSFTHFLGGLGIIVLFVAVLPAVGLGGRALFKRETSGLPEEGLTPRVRGAAIELWKLYIGLNVAETIALMIAGMPFYDALNHAMSTIATGGLSTRTTSIYAYESPAVEWIIIVFMFLGGTNFSLHLRALRGKFDYFRDVEFRFYFWMVVVSSLFIAAGLWLSEFVNDPLRHPGISSNSLHGIRDSFFTVISLQTTTGFGTIDYTQWATGIQAVLLLHMLFGGCSGSTSGGIKVIRWIILLKVGVNRFRSERSPNRVWRVRLGERHIDPAVAQGVLIFFFLWVVTLLVGTLLVALMEPEMSLFSVFSAVHTSLSNVGPGFDAVGPTANFSGFHAVTKWIFSALMLVGRLELYTPLLLLSHSFWRGR